MATIQDLRINFHRLKESIEELSYIGRSEDGGIYRQGLTENDFEARKWLQKQIESAGLEFQQDGALNISGKYAPEGVEGPTVLIGSHIDSVPAAGHLDGTLGVLTGLECLRTIKESGIEIQRPLEVISFTDEEGRFGGLFGSQALAGDLNPEQIIKSLDLEGVSIVDVLKEHGYDAMQALHAARSPKSIHSYLEIHIEQGPVLDREDLQIGIVQGITGLFKWSVKLKGQANHAGTTPMTMRQDAFSGLSEFSMEIPRILEENGTDSSVATIGKVSLFPGTANTVPGQVEFSLDVRELDPGILSELEISLRKALSAIARRRGLMFEYEVLSKIDPVRSDSYVLDAIHKAVDELGPRFVEMASGAVHDAEIIGKIARMGMIFVPSKGGKSHTPAEWTAWEDIEMGANVTLKALLQMATN